MGAYRCAYWRRVGLSVVLALALAHAITAQQSDAPKRQQDAIASGSCQTPEPAPAGSDGLRAAPAPAIANSTLCLTLKDAIERARKYNPQFQSVVTDAAIAHQDGKQALANLLPSVTYHNSFIYTQPGGAPGTSGVRFVANNAVHEYISQGNAHEAIGVAEVAAYLRTNAAAAAAKAKSEIAARGLVTTVVQLYYSLAAAEAKAVAAQQTSDQGDDFLKLTRNLETGGEVAHSDTIKAELQVEDRRRQWKEAQLAVLNARLDLAVVLFPKLDTNFALADDLHAPSPMPRLEEVQALAAKENPDVRAALETVRESGYDVTSARGGYLPTLSLDYFYGIDAPNFARRYQGFDNLGYSAAATLNIPIWNWGVTQSRVKQAELRREQSNRELSFEQRKLVAEIQSLYAEAETTSDEQAGLDRAVNLASESLRLTVLRYKNGEGTVLEVVDAQAAFARASDAYHDGAVRYRVALANLQTLTGVLPTP